MDIDKNMFLKSVLESIKGNDPIEELEYELFKMETRKEELDSFLSQRKAEVEAKVHSEYVKARMNDDETAYLFLQDTATRSIKVHNMLEKDEDFVNAAKSYAEIDVLLNLGKIRLDQLKRSFDISLPAVKFLAKLKVEEAIKDKKSIEIGGIKILAGSPSSIFEALNKEVFTQKTEKKVHEAGDVQYT